MLKLMLSFELLRGAGMGESIIPRTVITLFIHSFYGLWYLLFHVNSYSIDVHQIFGGQKGRFCKLNSD